MDKNLKKNFIFFWNLKFWVERKREGSYSITPTVSVGWGHTPPSTPQDSDVPRILLSICTRRTVVPSTNKARNFTVLAVIHNSEASAENTSDVTLCISRPSVNRQRALSTINILNNKYYGIHHCI